MRKSVGKFLGLLKKLGSVTTNPMKRIKVKSTLELKLQRRLELVRTTVRELTPEQYRQVRGGRNEITNCCPLYTQA